MNRVARTLATIGVLLANVAAPRPTGGDVLGTPGPQAEFRGIWIASVGNREWPAQPGLPVAQLKASLLQALDLARDNHFNAVVLQVRPVAYALVTSKIEPWSAYLTGR
jgi:uncharacterized lipoprotein YddW (UPF0748 family)